MVAHWLEIIGSFSMVITTTIALTISFLYLINILLTKGCTTPVSTLLSANTFLAALTYSSAHFSIAISMFRSDLATKDSIRMNFYNSFCMSSAFTFYSGCALLYYSYVMQAAQRFVRVVLHDYPWLYERRTQLIFIVCQWLSCISITLIPLVIAKPIKYNIYLNMCVIPITSNGWTMYYAIFCYSIPLICLSLIYYRLINYILSVRSRVSACLISGSLIVAAQRQLALIQRVIILVTILTLSGIPYCIFIGMGFFMEPPKYQFRISFLCVDIALASVICTMFHFSRNANQLRRR